MPARGSSDSATLAHGSLGLDVPTAIWLLYPVLLFALPNSLRPGALPVAPESLLLFLLLFCQMLTLLAFRDGDAPGRGLARVPWPAWLLLGCIGIAWLAAARRSDLLDLLRPVLWTLTFGFGFLFAQSDRRRALLYRAWSLLALLGAGLFLASPGRWGESRVDLLAWEHRTTFGYFLVFPALLHLQRLLGPREERRPLRDLAALVILVVAILMTHSRGAWLVLYVGGLVLCLCSGLRASRLLAVGVALTAAVLFATESETAIARRLRGTWDLRVASSTPYRVSMYIAAVRAVPDVGLVGEGPGTAARVLDLHTSGLYRHLASPEFVTDSDPVWLLIEAGPVAALALLALLAWWGRRLLRLGLAGPTAGTEAPRVAALFILLAAMLCLDNILMTPLGWFLLAFGLGATVRLLEERKRGDDRV